MHFNLSKALAAVFFFSSSLVAGLPTGRPHSPSSGTDVFFSLVERWVQGYGTATQSAVNRYVIPNHRTSQQQQTPAPTRDDDVPQDLRPELVTYYKQWTKVFDAVQTLMSSEDTPYGTMLRMMMDMDAFLVKAKSMFDDGDGDDGQYTEPYPEEVAHNLTPNCFWVRDNMNALDLDQVEELDNLVDDISTIPILMGMISL